MRDDPLPRCAFTASSAAKEPIPSLWYSYLALCYLAYCHLALGYLAYCYLAAGVGGKCRTPHRLRRHCDRVLVAVKEVVGWPISFIVAPAGDASDAPISAPAHSTSGRGARPPRMMRCWPGVGRDAPNAVDNFVLEGGQAGAG